MKIDRVFISELHEHLIEFFLALRRFCQLDQTIDSDFNHSAASLFDSDRVRWSSCIEEAEAEIVTGSGFEAYATDIDPRCVEIASAAAERAGVKSSVNTFVMDALDIDTLGRRGTVVTNPPYGDRLLTREEADDLYRAMGQAFSRLDRWQIYVITQSENFQKLYGRRADKIRKLYNGMIPCYYYQFFKNPPRG